MCFFKLLRIRVLFLMGVFAPALLCAQQTFLIQLPDVNLAAKRVIRGDGDTYGLGDWQCTFTVSLDGLMLKLDGKLVFTEQANDFTTIVGEYHQRIPVEVLERCRHCTVSLAETTGSVHGPNIGARGYRWFEGQGLLRRAFIQTDVFGSDAGNIGGTIQFAPIRVLVDCAIVEVLSAPQSALEQAQLGRFMALMQVKI